MGVEILRPNSTIASAGVLTGAATRHEALADDSDSSYVTLNTQGAVMTLGFELPTFPAGAVGFALTCRFRASGAGSIQSWFQGSVTAEPEVFGTISIIPPASPSTFSVMSPAQPPITDEPTAISVQVFRANGGIPTPRIYEMEVRVFYIEKPELTVDSPSGTVDDTAQPTVAWTPDLDITGGHLQSHFEAKVFTDAQYGAGGFDPATSTPTVESGEVASSSASWQVDEGLFDDTYRAYVRIAQTVNGALHWSDWEYAEFTVDVDLPAVPTLTLTPEPDQGRMRLDLADNAGDATTNGYEVYWSHDNGTTWIPLRTVAGNGRVSGTDATVYDHEAPNGQDVTYIARAGHVYSLDPEIIAWSDWVQDTDQWASNEQWLKHPANPALNTVVHVHEYSPVQRAARQGVFQPLGRQDAVVVSDTRGIPTATVTFRVDTEADQEALDALLEANTTVPLLLQMGANDKRPDRWVVFAQHDRAAIIDKSWIEPSLDTLTWTQVARP